jgi:hypothetical protein
LFIFSLFVIFSLYPSKRSVGISALLTTLCHFVSDKMKSAGFIRTGGGMTGDEIRDHGNKFSVGHLAFRLLGAVPDP